eukprot:2215974-Heterocapsa_arctica.AAC.1
MRGPSKTSKANRATIAARVDTALKAWPGFSESIPENDLFDDCFETEDPDLEGVMPRSPPGLPEPPGERPR